MKWMKYLSRKHKTWFYLFMIPGVLLFAGVVVSVIYSEYFLATISMALGILTCLSNYRGAKSLADTLKYLKEL